MILACRSSIGVSRPCISARTPVFCRHKSLRAAIERGIQYSGSSGAPRAPRTHRQTTPSTSPGGPKRYDAFDKHAEEQSLRSKTSSRPGRSPFDRNERDRRPASRESRPQQDRNAASAVWKDGPARQESGYKRGDSENGGRVDVRRTRGQGEDARQPRPYGDGVRPPREYEKGARQARPYGGDTREPRTYGEGARRPREYGEGARRPREYGEERQQHRPESQQYTPENFPYTTAASEFLYGYSVVLAAIKSGRRKLYNLYIHERGVNHEGNAALVAEARRAKVNIQEVGENYLPVMDRASSGRPHNGFILEASPLPRPPIVKLSSSSLEEATFKVDLDHQSREDKMVNGIETSYTYTSAGWRHPLLLYVDGVLDEGNLGAIARSAYFLGVDAIATPTRQSAPWSHIALKASAGAAEAIPIFTVNKPAEFLGQSAREGWRIYASDAIPDEVHRADLSTASTVSEEADDASSTIVFTHARHAKRMPANHCPVASHPTILMMGAEGAGLRSSLLNQANYKVGIRAGRQVNEIGLDSLNVSVAASLLCFEFLKKPSKPQKMADSLF